MGQRGDPKTRSEFEPRQNGGFALSPPLTGRLIQFMEKGLGRKYLCDEQDFYPIIQTAIGAPQAERWQAFRSLLDSAIEGPLSWMEFVAQVLTTQFPNKVVTNEHLETWYRTRRQSSSILETYLAAMEREFRSLEGRIPLDRALKATIEGLSQEQLRIPLLERLDNGSILSFQDLKVAAFDQRGRSFGLEESARPSTPAPLRLHKDKVNLIGSDSANNAPLARPTPSSPSYAKEKMPADTTESGNQAPRHVADRGRDRQASAGQERPRWRQNQVSPGSSSPRSGRPGQFGRQERSDSWGNRENKGSGNDLCHHCHQSGHYARDCPTGPTCYNCHQPGHMSHECRS